MFCVPVPPPPPPPPHPTPPSTVRDRIKRPHQTISNLSASKFWLPTAAFRFEALSCPGLLRSKPNHCITIYILLQASLRVGLLSRKFSRDELIHAGILQDKTPGQLAGERADTAGRVRRHLQHRSAGSAADLLAADGKVSGRVEEERGGRWFHASRYLCCMLRNESL